MHHKCIIHLKNYLKHYNRNEMELFEKYRNASLQVKGEKGYTLLKTH